MYALKVLRSHGLKPQMLHEVTKMTTIASLMYASPAWWGYCAATLPPMTAPELISYLESLRALAFCQKRLQMPRPWLVKLMTASLSLFFWIQTTSCESIFLRQDLQTVIYALELTSSNSL